MKMLVIDDSMTARLIVKRALESEGHTVLEAPDGAVGLTVLQVNPRIDAIILDWNMPVMNGFDCLTEIRSNPAYNGIKIIMCTTEAERGQVVRAIKSGANGYVLKPFTPPILMAAVNKVMGTVPQPA